jgi:hypothetical protein
MRQSLAEIAIEYWKLLKSQERAVAAAPADAQQRLSAQGRYAAGRLSAILEREGLRIVEFDGQTFEVNLPAMALNADEMPDADGAIVERTIEPAIVSKDGGVVIMGKVYLMNQNAEGLAHVSRT